MTIPHQGLAEEDKSLALTREVNLDTQRVGPKSKALPLRQSAPLDIFFINYSLTIKDLASILHMVSSVHGAFQMGTFWMLIYQ